MKRVLIILLVAVLAVGSIWFFALRDDGADNAAETAGSTQGADQTTAGQSSDTDNNPDEDEATADSVTIVYTNSGFTPRDYTVKTGSTVTVRNDSDETLAFASDPHPMHTDNLQLNAGDIRPGTSSSFELTQMGTWGFHNHDRESHTGTIKVE